jgi:hypothetical protein
MMNIEKIAAKLRPLMPKKVDHWMRAREMVDPELKTLIEKQIISTAYKMLGDFNKKTLLSLPPEQKCKGSINLGTVLYDKEKWPLDLKYGELIQNTVILGRSGSGKTNLTFHILGQLIHKNIPFVFMDWKRTVRHMLPQFMGKLNIYTPGRSISKFPFNPFVVPPGIESHVYVNQLVDVMSQAFTLGDGSKSILRKAIAALYAQGNLCPSVADIVTELKKVPDTGRMGGWKVTAMRALESLEFSDLSSADPITQAQLAQTMLHENTVVELDGLAAESKKFLIPILTLWLYYVRLNSPDRERVRLILCIEEAHHVIHKKLQTANETVLEMIFRQCRELGMGICLNDQHAHLLSSAALGNAYTTIFLNQKDPSDINKAAAMCQLDADDKSILSSLATGEGIVRLADRWTRPIHVKFPLVNINKGSVSDATLTRYSALKRSKTAGSGWKTFLPAEFKQVPQIPTLLNSPLNEDSFRLLYDIVDNPNSGVKIRYKRLNLSTGKGNRLKQHLLEQGWLHSQTIDLGQTRKVILALTKQAKEILEIKNTQPEHGSLVHKYWQNWYAQKFREHGYQVSLETPRPSGSIDIVAEKDGHKLAIEIESGLSDFKRNIQQNLLAKYDIIFIIATSKTTLNKIEKKLAPTGLLIPQKVRLILQDNIVLPLELESSTPL